MIEPPFTGPVRKIYFDTSGTDGFVGTQIIIDDTPLQQLIDRCVERSSTNELSEDLRPFSKHCAGFDERDVLRDQGTSVANHSEHDIGPAVVFMCSCLCEECWDSSVTVKFSEQHVHWYNFQIGSRNGKPLHNFGIITFDRQQYVAECERLKQAVFDRVTKQIEIDALILEESHLKPEIRSSRNQLDALLHADFVEIGASGKIYTRAQILDALPSPKPSVYKIHDFHARAIDPPTPYTKSIHTHYTLISTAPDGTSRHSLRSSIWVPGDGRMQLRFHQGTPIVGAR